MGIACILGRHEVVTRGIGNGAYEFGRCLRCACDLMRSGREWKRLPKGYKIVWKAKDMPAAGAVKHDAAAVGREVDLKGVTVVGERSYGAQRFALVVLNAKDRRDYGAMVDRLGTDGVNGRMMKKSSAYSHRGLLKPRTAAAGADALMAEDALESLQLERNPISSAPQGSRRQRVQGLSPRTASANRAA